MNLHTIQSGTNKPPPGPTKNNILVAKSLNIGYYLMTPILLGVFLGLAIDNFFKTKPLFTFVLLACGVISTFYNLYKLTKEQF